MSKLLAMTASLLALVACSQRTAPNLTAGPTTQDSVSAPIEDIDAMGILGKIDGSDVLVEFDPGSPITIGLNNVHKGSQEITFANGQTLQINVAATDDTGPTDTVKLGADALHTIAIGLDLYQRQVVFWPAGTTQAQAWVNTQPTQHWPKPTGVNAVPFTSLRDKSYALPAQVQGRQVLLRILPTFYRTGLSAAAITPSNGQSQNNFAYGVSLDSVQIDWLFNTWHDLFARQNYRPFDGAITIENIPSPRVLFDFPHSSLLFDKYTKDDRLTISLNLITRSSVAIKNGRCVIGGPAAAEDVASLEGSTISSVAGMPGPDIVKALENPSKKSAQLLNRLYLATKGEFKCEAVLPGGRKKTWTVPELDAYPPPD